MILQIDTTQGHDIEIKVFNKEKEIVAQKKEEAKYAQAEKLLLAIDGLLRENEFTLDDIKRIRVESKGGSFTALRIGVITANALAYALDVPIEGSSDGVRSLGNINIVEPEYSGEPSIN